LEKDSRSKNQEARQEMLLKSPTISPLPSMICHCERMRGNRTEKGIRPAKPPCIASDCFVPRNDMVGRHGTKIIANLILSIDNH